MQVTDPPPKPDEPGWDAWVNDQLADADVDVDLGKRLAEDARRVAAGELSAAEFHQRHHEAVEAAFGIDERPTKAAVEDDDPSPGVPDTRGRSRRRVLQALGGIAAVGATGLAGCIEGRPNANSAPSGNNPANDDDDVQLGMVVDTNACVACLQCSLACKEENDTDVGVHWPYVFRYEDDQYGDPREGYLTRHCQHCSEPTCTYVCPTQARYKRTDDGVVLTDYDTCIGCRYCQVACPYGVNYLGRDNPTDLSDGFEFDAVGRDDRTVAGPPPEGVMGKCTFCVHRQDSDDEELQGTTACEQRCPYNAIHFGDMNDPDSDPRTYLREQVPDEHHFKLLDGVGNEPNIVFVGSEPSKDATPVQGPVAYEDHGMVDGDYDYVTDGGDES